MNTSFNFYDFISYIIPGAVVLALLYWFAIAFLAIPPNIGGGLPESILLIVFLAASYFLGHLIQAVGGLLQKRWRQSGWEIWPPRYFDLDNRHYTYEYKKNLVNFLQQSFPLHPIDATEVPKQQNEIFHFCHALLRQEHLEANTDTLEAICNFFRGLYVAGWTSAVICTLIFLKELLWLIVLLISGSTLSNDPFFNFSKTQLLIGALLSLLFLSSIFWLRPRWQQYMEYYVDSVYTNVYVWYQKKKNDEQKQVQEGASAHQER